MPPEGQTFRALTAWTTRRRVPWTRLQMQTIAGVNQKLADYYLRRLIDTGHAEPAGHCARTGKPVYRRAK